MEQAELLRHVVEVLEEQGIIYLLVGSLASGVYGEPRLTHDIDVVVDLASGQVERLCAAFPDPEYYVSRQAAHDAVAAGGQFNVILGKLWYYREGGSEKHLRDIAGMMQISGHEIDTRYIDQWTQQLGLDREWQVVLDRLRGRM